MICVLWVAELCLCGGGDSVNPWIVGPKQRRGPTRPHPPIARCACSWCDPAHGTLLSIGERPKGWPRSCLC